MSKNNKIVKILTLLTLLTIFIPTVGKTHLLSEVRPENQSWEWENLLEISESQLPLVNPSVQYNYSVNWTNQDLILNESFIFNHSTFLTMDNCFIELAPLNLSDIVEIILPSTSKLIINNSMIFRRDTSKGSGSIIFSGDQVVVRNSTFFNLGKNSNSPGLLIQDSTSVTVTNSTFSRNFRGVMLKDCINIKINTSIFKNTIREFNEGIRGEDCINIEINNNSFTNMNYDSMGITLKSALNVTIYYNEFNDYGLLGINIECDFEYPNVQNVNVTLNTFQNGGFGVSISGLRISIKKNIFLNLQGTGMNLQGRFHEIIGNTFINMSRGIAFPFFYWTVVTITDLQIKNNLFTNIANEVIYIINYDGVTRFSIETNNMTNVGTAFAFEGNLGGLSEEDRSVITGNIIRNTTNYAISGTYWDNLARLQHLEINLNAFIDCKPDYTSFETDYYYLIDVRWDDGMFGNFWDELNSSIHKSNDEDSNFIKDDFYVVNAIHGQVDLAPLLSFDFIFEDDPIGSTHPSDFTRTQKELTVNNTLEWEVNRLSNLTVQIWVNNESSTDYTTTTNFVRFDLDKLNDGLYNITLAVSHDTIFRDTVWVTILPPETNIISDILIPLGTIGFIVAIVAVITFGFVKKRR